MNYCLLFCKSTFIVLFVSVLLVFLFNKKIGILIPISFCIIGLLYYVSGLIFNNLFFGKILAYILSIIGILFIIKEKNNKKIISLVLTKGLLCYFVLSILIFIYCYRYQYCSWDEFSHWGPMLRTMFTNNTFYTRFPNIGGAHIDYPPFISLIELFYCNLYGFYSESVASIGLHILELSFIIPVMFDIDETKNNINRCFISILLLVTIIMLDTYPTFRSIYIDIPIALMAVYPIIIINNMDLRECYQTCFLIIISLICIVLTKQIGIAFALCDLFIFFYYVVFVDKQTSRKKKLLVILLTMIIIVFAYLSWSFYVQQYKIAGHFDVKNLYNSLLSFNLNDNQVITLNNYLIYLLNESVIEGPINVSFVGYMIIGLLLYIIYYWKSALPKKEKISYIILFILSNIGYVIVIGIIICFSFGDTGMLQLNSIDRYLSSICIYNVIIMELLFFKKQNNNNKIVLAILVIFTISFNAQIALAPRILIEKTENNEECRKEQILVADYINQYIKPGKNILILSDRLVDVPHFNYLTNNKCRFYVGDVYYSDIDLLDKFLDYDYVVFEYVDMNEPIKLLSKYCNTEILYSEVLYEIKSTNGNIELLMMN